MAPAIRREVLAEFREDVGIPLFSSLVSIFIAGLFVLSRIGFDSKAYAEILPYVGICSFVLHFPSFFKLIILQRRFTQQTSFVFSKAGLISIGLLLVTGAGMMSPSPVNFLGVFVFLGFLFLLISLISYSIFSQPKYYLIHLVVVFLYSIWLGTYLWWDERDPLLWEWFCMGLAPIDQVVHAAMSRMIQLYGVPSTGLDGLVRIPYHYGSHWWIAQISNLLQTSPVRFYENGYPTLCFPLLINNLLLFSSELRKFIATQLKDVFSDFSIGWREWVLLMVIFVGIFPWAVVRSAHIYNLMMGSESYVISLAFSFLFFTWLLAWFQHHEEGTFKPQDILFIFILCPSFIIILGFLKFSSLFLFSGLFFYFFLRLGWVRMWWAYVPFIVVAASDIFFMKQGTDYLPPSTDLFNFVNTYVPAHLHPFYVFLTFFWSFLFIGLRIWAEKATTLGDVKQGFRKNKFLDVEGLMLLCLLGILPGNILALPFFTGNFFSDLQQYIAMALLVTWCPKFLDEFKLSLFSGNSVWRWKTSGIFIGLGVLPFAFTFYKNAEECIFSYLNKNIISRREILKQGGLGPEFEATDSVSSSVKILMFEPAQALKKTVNYDLMMELKALESLPHGKTILFIPQTNKRYWNSWNDCRSVPLIAPALTGLPLLLGLSPACYPNYPYDCYGYRQYPLREIETLLNQYDDNMLCTRALSKGFSTVIVLDTDSTGQFVQRQLPCAKSTAIK